MVKNKVLIITSLDNFTQLNNMLSEWYSIGVALNIKMARSSLKLNKPDLILLDAQLLETDFKTKNCFCSELKEDGSTTQEVPILLLCQNKNHQEMGYTLDVVDHIELPFQAQIIRRRISSQLALYRAKIAERVYAKMLEIKVEERTHELAESQRAAIFMLGEAGHYNDTDTGVHIWRMAAYSAALAKEAGWDDKECERLELAAPMHDTGKIGISDSILKKPASLDDNQWVIMKSHAEIGRDILAKGGTPLFNLASEVAASHHERWDGTGYPDALKKEQIPWSARIVAIADVFDALTMKRPYKEPWTTEDAFEEIKKNSGSHFDPALVDNFLSIKDKILSIKDSFNK